MRATLLGLLLVMALVAHAADDEEDEVLDTGRSGGTLNERLEALEREWQHDVGAPPAIEEPDEERPAHGDPDEVAPPVAEEEEPGHPTSPPPTFGEAAPSRPADSGSTPSLGKRVPSRPPEPPSAHERAVRPRPEPSDPAE